MIISDSISGRIKLNQMKNNIDTSKETAVFKRFPGHTASEISFYAHKPFGDYRPDQVIIVAGTNSLTRDFYEKDAIDEYEIVNEILEIARVARSYGVSRIHV